MASDLRTLFTSFCGCSSVVEHLLAKERVESSNLFIRFLNVNWFKFLLMYNQIRMSLLLTM